MTLCKRVHEHGDDKHTFFVDGDGLHVWESTEEGPAEGGKMVGLRVATWKDESRTTHKCCCHAISSYAEVQGRIGLSQAHKRA